MKKKQFYNNLSILILFLAYLINFSEIHADDADTSNYSSDIYTSYEGESQHGGSNSVSSIVNPRSGDLMRQEVDLTLDGPIPVKINRWYLSGTDYEKVGDYSGTHDMGNWDNHQGEIVYQTYVPAICNSDCYDITDYPQDTTDPNGVAPPILNWNRPDGTVRKFYYETASNPYKPYKQIDSSDGTYVIVPVGNFFIYKSMEGDILNLTYGSESNMTMEIFKTDGMTYLFQYGLGSFGFSIKKPSIHPPFWDIDLTKINSRYYFPIYRVLQLTKINDQFGNEVNVRYETAQSGSWTEGDGLGLTITNYSQQSRITSILDSYERKLKYEYYDNQKKRLKRIYLENSSVNFQVEYNYQLMNTNTLVQNGITKPSSEDGGYYALTEVIRPGNSGHWKYSYYTGASGEKTNFYGTLLLRKVEELNFGENETYYYKFVSFLAGYKSDGTSCFNTKQVVYKAESDSYQGYLDTTTYNYSTSGITTVNHGTENIQDIYYYFQQSDQDNWKSGLLNKRTHNDYDLTEEVSYTYVNLSSITSGVSLYGLRPDTRYSTSCSYDDRINTRDTGIKRVGIAEQVIRSKSGTSSNFTDETEFSNFDYNSNQWQTKEETGPNGVSRTTYRTYWSNFQNNKNLIGKLETEKYCITDSVTKDCGVETWSSKKIDYLPTGLDDKKYINNLLISNTDYFDNSKRIYRIYDGNSNYKEFGNYTYGEIARQESITGSPVILDRTVNYEGMIQNETNVLEQTVSLGYDSNNVLELFQKPLEKDTTIHYYPRKYGISTVPTMYIEKIKGNNKTHIYFDGLGKKRFEYNELGIGKKYNYNSDGRISFIQELIDCTITVNGSGQYTPSYSKVVRTTYFDKRGRKSSVEEDGNEVLSLNYDDASNTVTQTDGEGNQVKYQYESFGHVNNKRLQSRTDGIGLFELPIFLRKIKRISLNQIIDTVKAYLLAMVHFGSNEKIIIPSLDNTVTNYSYTSDGQLKEVMINGEVMRTYTYDSITKRLLKIEKKESLSPIEFTYDNVGHVIVKKDGKGTLKYLYNSRNLLDQIYDDDHVYYKYTYDSMGKILNVTDLKNYLYWFYTYDDANRITQIVFRNYTRADKGSGRILNKFAIVVNAEYNVDGLLSKLVYPDGTYLSYTYNSLNQLIKLDQYPSVGTPSTFIQQISYKSFGRIDTIHYGDSIFSDVSYGYDNALRRNSIKAKRGDGSHFIDLGYEYYLNDKISIEKDNILSDNTMEYGYDYYGRLTIVLGPWGEIDYEYDGFGNKINEVMVDKDGNALRDRTYHYSNASENNNRLTDYADDVTGDSVYFGYDNAGNNKYYSKYNNGKLSTNYERDFDLFGNLFAHVDLKNNFSETDYLYSFQGKRIRKIDDEKNTTWYIEGPTGNVIAEIDPRYNILKYHYYLGSKKFMTENGETKDRKVYYYNNHGDVVGTITKVNGETTAKEELIIAEPFGLDYSHIGNSSFETDYGMEGKEKDKESGLYYFGARYYDADIGRFISFDPIDGKPGDTSENYNGYSYAFNDPINGGDPTGMAEAYNTTKGVMYNTDYGIFTEGELEGNIDNYEGSSDKLDALRNAINEIFVKGNVAMKGSEVTPEKAFDEAINILGFQALIRSIFGRPERMYSINELAKDAEMNVESNQFGKNMREGVLFMIPGGGEAVVGEELLAEGGIEYLGSGGGNLAEYLRLQSRFFARRNDAIILYNRIESLIEKFTYTFRISEDSRIAEYCYKEIIKLNADLAEITEMLETEEFHSLADTIFE